MGKTHAIMLTMTTYGSWRHGDLRGWVDKGKILPPDPEREAADQQRMKHAPYQFPPERLIEVGHAIGISLRDRLHLRIAALAVRTWHVHVIVTAARYPVPTIVKCGKDAARWLLRPGRPIWTEGYDKRFCFDEESVKNRVAYVERHNMEAGLPARPWPFIEGHSAALI